jgi:ketosteroid isomerase-like protein
MDEQLAGHIEGRQTLRDMMAGFPKMYASFQNVPRRVVVDDDKVAVFSHISAQTHDGESIEADVANYFHVVGGEIVYMRNIHDTAPFRPVLARSAAQ